MASSPTRAHDLILAVVKTDAVLFVERTGLSRIRSQSLSMLAIYTYVRFLSNFFIIYVFSFSYIVLLLLRPVDQVLHSLRI